MQVNRFRVTLPLLVVISLAGGSLPALGGSEQSVTFNPTFGPQAWTVPADVHEATFDLVGAAGGQGIVGWPRAKGARLQATIPVTPGEVLQINVGGMGGSASWFGNHTDPSRGKGGWNGGGDGGELAQNELTYRAPGGGGGTDVRRDSNANTTYSLAERILVAGGGGGNSYNHPGFLDPGALGGEGGKTGGDGMPGRSGGYGSCADSPAGIQGVGPGEGVGGGGGAGGGLGSGGLGGAAGDAQGVGGSNLPGDAGSLGRGGDGGDARACVDQDPGGGGGGGYWGGGGGGGAAHGNGAGGGGGGSSLGPAGATFTDGYGSANGSVVVRFTPDPDSGATYRPDARVRLGTTGAFVGDDIYNSDGVGQSRTGKGARGATITFGLSIQSDATRADQIGLKATGAASAGYSVRYFKGTTDITAAVIAGSWTSGPLGPGKAVLVTIKVTVKRTAPAASKVVRTLTARSNTDGSVRDVVKVTGKRS